MGKILDEINKLATASKDDALIETQIKKVFCLTQGMQIWSQLEDLNIAIGAKGGKPQRQKQPFPGLVHDSCPCDDCVSHRALNP